MRPTLQRATLQAALGTDLVVGKMPNPFYMNTELLMDADISPTGLAQKFKFPVSPVSATRKT